MPDPVSVERGVWADDQFVPTEIELVRSPFASPGASTGSR